MSVAAKPLTWADIASWPEDSSRRTELVHGELVVSPSPGSQHQICVTRLTADLTVHVRERDLGLVLAGPIDVVLAEDVVYVPDLCFVRRARLETIQDTHIAGPPDLCVEIISESNRTHDTVVKFQDYARFGVAEYWLADLRERQVSTWRNEGESFSLIGRASPGDRIPSITFPELDLDPAKLFSRS